MKTIAQQLKVKEFPLEIKDSNGNEIYSEESDGYWVKREFDSSNNQIYSENSDGYWIKREYDSSNNEVYYENSKGRIRDSRVIPEYTIEQLQKMLGKEFKIVK
jgi:hypothetical protein